MAQDIKLNIVLDGQKLVLTSIKELQFAYMDVYKTINSSPIQTKLDERTMKENFAQLDRLQKVAKSVGASVEDSVKGMSQQWDYVDGKIMKVTESINASGAAVKKYEAFNLQASKASEAAAVAQTNQANIAGQNVQNTVQKTQGGFNAMSNSINQLTREAPAFAVSANTGFLAISNNLPILLDAIQQANSQGKSAFRELIKGVFSLQTAFSVGVTLLTIYGGKLIDVISGIGKMADQDVKTTKEMIDSRKRLNDAINNTNRVLTDALSKEISQFLILSTVARDTNRTLVERNAAIAQLNETQKANLTLIGEQNIALNTQIETYNKLTMAIIEMAVSQAATGLIEAFVKNSIEGYGKVAELEDRISQKQIERQKAEDDYNKKRDALIAQGADGSAIEKMLKAETQRINQASVAINDAENSILLIKGDLSGVEKKASEAARGLAAMMESLKKGNSPFLNKLIEMIKLIVPLVKVLPKTSSSSTSTKSAFDPTQYLGSFEDIIEQTQAMIKDQSGTFADITEGINAAKKAMELYLKTIKTYTAATKAAQDANDKLEAEQTKGLKERGRIERERNEDLLKFFKSFKYDKAAFSGSDVTRKAIEDTIKDFENGKISLDEAAKRLITRDGKVLPVFGLDKYTSELNKVDAELETRRKEIEKNQLIINKDEGDKVVAERKKMTEQVLKVETEAANSLALFRDKAIKAELEQADELTRQRVINGKATLDELLTDVRRDTQTAITEELKKVEKQVRDGNQIIAGVFTDTGDRIEIDEVKLKDLYDIDPGFADAALGAINATNATINGLNIERLSKEKNANDKFLEEFITAWRVRNEQEIERTKVALELLQNINQISRDDIYRDIESDVERRRRLGKKQSDEELALILKNKRRELSILDTSFKNENVLRTQDIRNQILEAEKNGFDTIKLRAELANIEVTLEEEKQEELRQIREKYIRLIDKDKPEKIDYSAIIQAAQRLGKSIVDYANQLGENIIAALQVRLEDVEGRYDDTLDNINRLEDELEGKRSGRRDAVLQALELQRMKEIQLAKEKISLAERIEKEERKIKKRNQIAAIAEATINGALAITNVFATTPPPLSFILAGITAATTGFEIATIASQKFAKGGFTGSGSNTDETGHKVAGIVHNDEWVAPKWMVESPKFGSVINQLENARTKGFAEGGFASPDFGKLSSSVSPNNTAKLESMLASYNENLILLSNRPIMVSATEVQNVNSNANRRRAESTL